MASAAAVAAPRPPPLSAAAVAATTERRLLRTLVPLSLLLLLLAPAPAAGAEVPSGGQPSLTPDRGDQKWTGTVTPGNFDIHRDIQPPVNTNPAIVLTLTPLQGNADLYCSRGRNIEPGPDFADYQSITVGVNRDTVLIPPMGQEDLDKGRCSWEWVVLARHSCE